MLRHIPELRRNLISLGTLESHGCKYTGEGGVLKVSRGSLVLLKANRIGSLYVLQGATVAGSAYVASYFTSRRVKGMHLLSKRGFLGSRTGCKINLCEHCVFGKHKRASFAKDSHTSNGTLDYIQSDLRGPSHVPSSGGRYMCTKPLPIAKFNHCLDLGGVLQH